MSKNSGLKLSVVIVFSGIEDARCLRIFSAAMCGSMTFASAAGFSLIGLQAIFNDSITSSPIFTNIDGPPNTGILFICSEKLFQLCIKQ